ncbi:hypothetical protein ACOSQ3_023882 [Xanthoceras sorbifolium]
MNADEIASRCASLSLETDSMEPRIVLETPLKEAGDRKLALCLVGKILTTKLINRDAFRAIIPKIWRTTQTFIIENVKENVFVFQFQNQVDKRRVLMGGPWSFDKCLIVLEEPLGVGKFQDMGFSNVQFWVQIHNVPLVCMTKEIGWALGNKIGRVMDIDVGATGDCLGRFLRVRVGVDVTKPLNRYLRVCLLEGDPDTVLLLRYERLTEYCFQCGVVGHVARECQIAIDFGGSSSVPDYKYGAWMRAESPPKVRFTRASNDSSTDLHRPNQGSTVPRSPDHVPLDTGCAPSSPVPIHTRSAPPKMSSPLNLAPGSEVNSYAHISKTLTVLAGAAEVREAVGSTKSSDLRGPATMARAVPSMALGSGLVGGVEVVVQCEETAPGALGEGGSIVVHGGLPYSNSGLASREEGSTEVLGLAAACSVDHSVAHVLGEFPKAHSGIALAVDHAVRAGASLVHPCVAVLDGHGSAAHVLPLSAVSTDFIGQNRVLPCMGFKLSHLVHGVGNPEEGVAASFTFSAHDGASKAGVAPSITAAMEVDRKHFKWKRAARRGLVGSGYVIQVPRLGKRVELEALIGGEGGVRVKRSRNSDNGKASLLSSAGPGEASQACQER